MISLRYTLWNLTLLPAVQPRTAFVEVESMEAYKMSQFSFFNLPSFFRSSASSIFGSLSSIYSWFKMRFSKVPLSGLVASGAAVNLYVSSYIGTITSLQLSQDAAGLYSLSQVAVNEGSAPSPAWLTLNEESRVLYALDEGLYIPNGSIASYKTSPSGELTQIDRLDTIWGPVSSVIYNEGKALAVAH